MASVVFFANVWVSMFEKINIRNKSLVAALHALAASNTEGVQQAMV